jgi:hypothetical protein
VQPAAAEPIAAAAPPAAETPQAAAEGPSAAEAKQTADEAADRALHKARSHRGALEFDAPEAEFVIDAGERVRAIELRVRNDAHKLVEECMILANVAVAQALSGETAGLVAGFGAMLGHAFPVWLGFKGGKGVATGGGVLLAAAWWLGLGTALVWLGMALLSRISSAASLAACAAAPLIALLAGRLDLAVFAAGIAALVIWRHQGNIQRLLAGTEPRIGRKG